MVPDTCCNLRRKKLAAGGLEEFHHRLVLKRRRVGEVDHHLRAGHDFFEPLARNGVHTALRRGRDDLVAALTQNGDSLRADQTGAPDDDDLHDFTSLAGDWRASRLCSSKTASSTRATRRASPRKKGARGC
jgi:hypothetical protein